MKIFSILLGSLFVIGSVFADTIILKSGQEVEGEIIEKTDEKVVLDVLGVAVPYFSEEIKSINGGSARVVSSQLSLGSNNSPEFPKSRPQQLQRKGSLVIVGDANLTYASYFFELPSSWVPLMDNMELTHERGFWRGKRANAQVWMQIVPTKKEAGQSIAGLVESAKEDSRRGGGCTGEFLKKYSQFYPSTSYPYEVYFMYDCPKNSYGLIVFLDLPTHFIVFNLYGFGKDENFITSYFDDFNKVINSFKWVLGLSDEEIGNMLNAGGTRQGLPLAKENKSSQESRPVSVSTKTAEGYLKSAMAYAAQGNFVQAISDFTESIQIDPNNKHVFYDRGTLYARQGEFEKAIADFNKAIEIDPNDINPWFNRGLVYLNKGSLDQALSDFNKVIEIDPKYIRAYQNLAVVYQRKGNHEQAIFNLNKAREMNSR